MRGGLGQGDEIGNLNLLPCRQNAPEFSAKL